VCPPFPLDIIKKMIIAYYFTSLLKTSWLGLSKFAPTMLVLGREKDSGNFRMWERE